MTCRTRANASHQHVGTAVGSEGQRDAWQAHAADAYRALAASAEAVQSATGGKNSLSREAESQRESRGRSESEGGMGGCRRRHRHSRESKMEIGDRRRWLGEEPRGRTGRDSLSLRLTDKAT